MAFSDAENASGKNVEESNLHNSPGEKILDIQSLAGLEDEDRGAQDRKMLRIIRSGITTDEELAYIAENYFAMEGDDRTRLIYRLKPEYAPEVIDFLKVAAIDTDVEPALAVAGFARRIELEAVAAVLALLLKHHDKSVRQAARQVVFELRDAGLAIDLDGDDKNKEETLWWEEDMPLHKIAFWTREGEAKVGGVMTRKRSDGNLALFGVLVDPSGKGIRDAIYTPSISEAEFEEHFLAPGRDDIMCWEGTPRDLEEIVRFGYELGGAIPLAFYQGKFLMGKAAYEFDDLDLYVCQKCSQPLEKETMDRLINHASIETLGSADFVCRECYERHYAPKMDDCYSDAQWDEEFDGHMQCFNCPWMEECMGHQDELIGGDDDDDYLCAG